MKVVSTLLGPLCFCVYFYFILVLGFGRQSHDCLRTCYVRQVGLELPAALPPLLNAGITGVHSIIVTSFIVSLKKM